MKMKTRTWETLNVFDTPQNGINLKFQDSPLAMPEGVEEIIRNNWDRQLEQKQRALLNSGIQTEILPYHLDSSKHPLNALYEDKKPKMWPGPVVSLKDVNETGENIGLLVGQTYFPFIAALKDEEVSNLYAEQGIQKPRPALAICTYAKTLDGELVLTVRGSRTNMYPSRLYGQGGNPLFTTTDVVEHQTDEMKDEALIEREDYNPNNFMFGGIVVDREQLPDKPDLIGWVPINLESSAVRERVYGRDIDKRPNDAVGVVFAPATESGLFDYLANRSHPVQFCPPAHAGLVLYGHANFGEEWSKGILKKIE